VEGGAFCQVSRLSHPLINEVIIGLADKDRFNASEPIDDAQFAAYVTDPAIPAIIDILFFSGSPSRATLPRNDLVAIFLTGIDGVIFNQPITVTASEMQRLNTSTPVTPIATQSPLGVLGGDLAGYPNGRRPVDDVVDIVLRAGFGALAGTLDPTSISGDVPNELNDGVRIHRFINQSGLVTPGFLTVFPFLADPQPPSFVP
jgi:hypothetical protein